MENASFKGHESIFSERLRTLLKSNHISMQALSDAIGTSRQAISQYCDGSTIPNADKLTEIAKFFNVSLDYLAGLSAAPTADKDIQFICDYTGLSAAAAENLHSSRELPILGEGSVRVINFFLEHEQLSPFAEIRGYKDYVNFALRAELADSPAKEKTAPESEEFIDMADTYRYRAVKALENYVDEYVPERRQYDELSRKKWEKRFKESLE